MKYAGAAYLLYLGAKTLRSGGEFAALARDSGDSDGSTGPDTSGGTAGSDYSGDPARADLRSGYLRGVTVNVLNPKVALFFLAFLPQFVGSGPEAAAEMLALGGTYAALTALYLGGVGLLSGGVRAAFRARPRLADGLRWVSGSILAALGAALALEAR